MKTRKYFSSLLLLISVGSLLMSCQTARVSPNRYEMASAEEKAHFKKVLLPLTTGTKFKISQGAFGHKSHSEPGNEYSWDFDVPYGTAVTAVEDGKVIDIWEPNGAGGCDPKFSDSAHNVKIEHADGTVAQYVHIRSAVKLGQLVHAGQVIATTEKNGWICDPQLHFGIYASKSELYNSPKRRTLPLSFVGLNAGLALEGTSSVVPKYPVIILSNWLLRFEGEWESQSAEKPYSIRRVSSPSRTGADSLRFEIRSHDHLTWNPTFRSEINTREFVPMGSEKWYGFSEFIPKDFPIEDNRLVIAQWWALTKKYLGEVHRSPILHLRFAAGNLQILLRNYSEHVVHNDESYQQTTLFELNPLPLGAWNDFIFHIKWSPSTDGFIEAWVNGKKVIQYHGITENQDDVGPVFKFGLYRDDSEKTYISYVSNYRIGNSYEEVDPSLKKATTTGTK